MPVNSFKVALKEARVVSGVRDKGYTEALCDTVKEICEEDIPSLSLRVLFP